MAKRTVTIRPLQVDDAADLYAIISRPEVAENLLSLPSMMRAETEEWVKKLTPGRHRLVAEQNGRVVGSATLTQFQNPRMKHAGSLGLMVHPDFWGQGVASALLAALIDLADNWLNLRRVELEVFSDNPAAIHLYEKAGFEREGVKRMEAYGNGRWRDSLLMARLHRPEPAGAVHIPAAPRRTDISTDDIVIRPPLTEDARSAYMLSINPLVAQTTMRLPSSEFETLRQRYTEPRQGVYTYLAVHDQRVVGWVNLGQDMKPRQAHSAGLGLGVHPDYWGIGVGTRLMHTILDLADNWLNLRRVELDVNVDNPAAVRLYRKLGFEIEGTRRMHAYGNGRWADSHFMARLRADNP